jgi:cytoskeletal protein RodZ
MSKLGATLKNKRETLGFDIDKATEETRISADIIAVLEAGEFKSMPSYNHAKNFVKNYASYLKLEMDKVQELFDEECTKEDFNREVKYVAAPVTKEQGSAPSGAKFIIPVVLVVVIAFLGFKVFMAMEKGSELKANETVKEEVKKDVDVTVDTPVSTEEVKEVIESINKDAEHPAEKPAEEKKAEHKPAAKAEKPAEPAKQEVKKEDSAALSAFLPDVKEEPMTAAKTAIVNFADVCWVHIKIDDKEEMDFIAEKGNQREVVFHDNFVMDIGNAAVVSISYNSRTIAGLGAYKQPLKGLKFTVNDNDRLTYTSKK